VPPGVAALPGLMFPFPNTPVVNAQGSSAAVGWQRLTDQLFGAFVRASDSASDFALVGTVRDTLEQSLTGQLPRSPYRSDTLDRLDWDEAISALEGPEAGDWSALGGQRGEAAPRFNPPVSGTATAADRFVLDQVFARSADESDPNMETE